MQIEQFLFIPVVVLLALIIVVLSFKLIFRFLALFIAIVALWYTLFFMGYAPSPWEVVKDYGKALQEESATFY